MAAGVAAEFIMSAVRPEDFPRDGLPEVAFLGRSNVGKSSLLNRLVGAKNLAFTSSKPGCTQAINFFKVDSSLYLVDLPGYGYARAPKEKVREWKPLVESYLTGREPLRLALLLLDSRRGWMDKDLDLKEWLEHHRRPYLVVATKIDKLKSRKDQVESAAALREHVPEDAIVPFSAVTGQGVRELWQAIWKTRNQ